MKVITLFDLATGEFDAVLTLPGSVSVESKVPEGFGFIAGRFDRLSQHVDVSTRQVVDHQPPQPDVDHEWRAENPGGTDRCEQRWRWSKKPEVAARERESAALLRQIEEIEQRQLRSISALLDDPNDSDARRNHDGRKAQIAKLREQRADLLSKQADRQTDSSS